MQQGQTKNYVDGECNRMVRIWLDVYAEATMKAKDRNYWRQLIANGSVS